MFALIYLGLAIALGDLLCRRFYRFVSIAHRWAAAMLVGVLLSTWFTYLAGLACYRTAEPLLWADLLFFLAAPSAIFCLSRKTLEMPMIAPRAPRSSTLDWIVPGALFAAVCVLLIGTLYVNKQGRISLSGMGAADFALQAAIVQNFALGHNFAAEYPHYFREPSLYRFLFSFQAGNLEFLGLHLAWSIDLLSLLGLTSVLALVMVLGELLFNSRVVGHIGAALFLFHGSLRHLTNFLPSGYRQRDETWGFWKELAFVNQRHLPFAIGIALLVLIFFAGQYRQRTPATAADSDVNGALPESNGIASANSTLRPAGSLVFSALLVAALPLGNAQFLMAAAAVLCCLLLAYGFWRLSRMKTVAMLGPIVAGTLTTCVVVAGVVDLWAVYRSPRIEVNYETQPLVKGFVFRNFLIYKIPESLPLLLAREDLSKPPVTAFEGGRGQGRGQFDSPRGIAADSAGNIFVADTGNGRIEKFSPVGAFLSAIGTNGSGHGQFGEPSGLAVDQAGNIYVAEASNHRVQKLAPNGTFISEWTPGLNGPRRIAIGPDNSIYVLDQGHCRIVKFNPDGHVLATWGNRGSGDGQMRDPTSVAVDSTNRLYVADPIGSRIQVLDSRGTFLTKFSIPEWGKPDGFEDVAIDPDRGRLYASSAHMSTILVFDLQGNRLGPLTQTQTDSPSGLALAKGKLFVLNGASSRVSVIVLQDR